MVASLKKSHYLLYLSELVLTTEREVRFRLSMVYIQIVTYEKKRKHVASYLEIPQDIGL